MLLSMGEHITSFRLCLNLFMHLTQYFRTTISKCRTNRAQLQRLPIPSLENALVFLIQHEHLRLLLFYSTTLEKGTVSCIPISPPIASKLVKWVWWFSLLVVAMWSQRVLRDHRRFEGSGFRASLGCIRYIYQHFSSHISRLFGIYIQQVAILMAKHGYWISPWYKQLSAGQVWWEFTGLSIGNLFSIWRFPF